MSSEYVNVDLGTDEKSVVLEYAKYCILDKQTVADLENKRKKWIRFSEFDLEQVIGELSYRFNRCNNRELSEYLDELIGHLEYYKR